MIKKIKEIGLIIFESIVIAAVTLTGVFSFSCKVTTEGIEIIGGDYSPPVIENLAVLSDDCLTLSFSESVNLTSWVISPFIEGISDSSEHSETESLSPSLAAAAGNYGKIESRVTSSEEGRVYTFNLESKTSIGKTYELYGVVLDKTGNSLTFCLPFTGFNPKIPKLMITEAQIKYGKGSVKGETVYRSEYLELLVLESGNLAGLEIGSASDGEEKNYTLPALEVNKGEILLVHFRTLGEGCINEYEDNLDLATAPHSKNGVRDLWLETNTSHFNDSSDVIFIKNSVDNSILDGLMYASDDADGWKECVAVYAQKLADLGFYDSSDISKAACSKGCSPLKSLTRSDGAEIAQKILEGKDVEYPVKVTADTWSVMPASPGVL